MNWKQYIPIGLKFYFQVLLLGKKTAEDTLQTAKLLMDHGLRDLINEADSLGNTPLHVLIARYALEERKLAHSNSKSYGYHDDHQVCNFKNVTHINSYQFLFYKI